MDYAPITSGDGGHTFNFFGPIYGDINGFLPTDCSDDEDGDGDGSDGDGSDGDGSDGGDLPKMSILSGYTFLDGDDRTCRENFIALEQQYLDIDNNVRVEALQVEEEKNALLEDIIVKAVDNGLELVDNKDFLNWSTTYGGPEDPDDVPEVILFEPVAMTFLTIAGASRITSVEELGDALDILYQQRAETEREFP